MAQFCAAPPAAAKTSKAEHENDSPRTCDPARPRAGPHARCTRAVRVPLRGRRSWALPDAGLVRLMLLSTVARRTTILRSCGETCEAHDEATHHADWSPPRYWRGRAWIRREVADGLAEVEKRREYRLQQEQLVRAPGEASATARRRYEGGVSNYLDVLDAERALFQAELDLATAQRDELNGFVRLYKAVGGGWQAAGPDLTRTGRTSTTEPVGHAVPPKTAPRLTICQHPQSRPGRPW
jgi:hypothetical protein